MKTFRKANKGFTLLEILLVVAALGILAGIVILAINPSKQLAATRNASRRSGVNTLLTAVYQYTIDNDGVIPETITTESSPVCLTGVSDESCIDLAVLSDNEEYLVELPQDPQNTSEVDTGYNIFKTANGRITVSAPNAESDAVISVTR